MIAADGKILACNTSAERILGLSSEQILDRTARDPRWHPVSEDGSPLPDEKSPVLVTLRTGKPSSNAIVGVEKPDGTLAWISVNSQPLFRPNEPMPYAVVASFSDITERKRIEEELRLLKTVK